MTSHRGALAALPSLDELLARVTVQFYVPGRLRFHLDFRGDAFLRDAMRRELQRHGGVRLESYSSRTRTALVTYHPERTSPAAIAESLLRGVKEFHRIHGECDLTDHRHAIFAGMKRTLVDAHEEHDDHGHGHEHDPHLGSDEGVRKEAVKLSIAGALLGWFVYRKLRAPSRPLNASPLSDLAALVTVVTGYPILRAGARSVTRGKPSDDTLISIAVIATLLLRESVTGLSVIWLIQLGRLLEAVTMKRSRLAIADLMDMAPPEAWKLLPPESEGRKPRLSQVRVEELDKGDVVRVFHFEKVPLDGRVLRGEALVQESFITGEALPKRKCAGDTVYAGSIVEKGEVDVQVTSVVHETLVARMVASVQSTHERRAPIERIGSRFAARFVPVSLGLAGVTLLWTRDWYKAVTMLVIACPCAAGLATPTAVSASIAGAAKKGILIKGGVHLEKSAKIDALVLDKTGTLTAGAPAVTDVRQAAGGLSADELLRLVGSVERHATHPLAIAMVNEARKRDLAMTEVDDYVPHPGLGVVGRVDGRSVQVGSLAFMRTLAVPVPSALAADPTSEVRGARSLVYVAVDGTLHAVLTVEDAIRPEAAEALAALRSLGIRRLVLATGDRQEAAGHVAAKLGLDEVHAELLPQDKFDLVDRLRAEGHRVAMVGDGINDALALAHADVSIAMGEGRCDLAIETADVTLARNDLMLVPETLRISQTSLRTIYQNFAASIGVNVIGLGFGAVGRLSPFAAAIVHNLSTIAVVINSFALTRKIGRFSARDFAGRTLA
ncbi:MAG: Lead, cadmium, zinc and mercury transporting ATPase [bacterium]|nr:Lead, cadmium, zinc and mercury transporting ATPase [bacterium]